MIAAYRARQHPPIVQVNERGFLTMLSSGAILPATELMEKAGHKINWSDFIAPVATYFTKDGVMMAMPFNSSTPILFYNADHFKAAGFDKPASTWPELEAQLYAISKKGVSKCAMVFPADWEWSFLENYSAIEDVPYATKRNGFDGVGAEYVFNKGRLVGHMERVKRFLDDGILELAGQGINPGQLFIAGRCSTVINSTAAHAERDLPADRKRQPGEEQHDRRRCAVDAQGPQGRGVQGRRRFLQLPRQRRDAGLVAQGDRLCAGNPGGLRGGEGAGLLQGQAHAGDRGRPAGSWHAKRQLEGIPPRQQRPGEHRHQGEIQAGLLGQKPMQKAMDDAVGRGNEVLRQFEKVNAGKY
jgi:sn-glycerol 3-phosphate transport system substrate-binding protein